LYGLAGLSMPIGMSDELYDGGCAELRERATEIGERRENLIDTFGEGNSLYAGGGEDGDGREGRDQVDKSSSHFLQRTR
jgi:hypothetical protein